MAEATERARPLTADGMEARGVVQATKGALSSIADEGTVIAQ